MKDNKYKHLFNFYGRRVSRNLSKRKTFLLDHFLPKINLLKMDIQNNIIDNFFSNNPIKFELEIGFGSGEHLYSLARGNKNIGYIGVEPYLNGIASLLNLIEKNKTDNILIYPDDFRKLIKDLPKEKFSNIYILFPDPWPKKRHINRRILNKEMLHSFYSLLSFKGKLIIATDHSTARTWILSNVLLSKKFIWLINNKEKFYVKVNQKPKTRYMQKAFAEGRKVSWFEFEKT